MTSGSPVAAPEPDDARMAYEVAAQLYMQENAVTWARFSVMLAAHALVLAATGIAMQNIDESRLILLARALPIGGLLLCVLWWGMMTRGFAYHDVWRDAAYAIERHSFGGRVSTLRYGEELKRCGWTAIPVRDRIGQRRHESGIVRRFTARRYAQLVILVFFGLYLVAALQIGIVTCMRFVVDRLDPALSEEFGRNRNSCRVPPLDSI
jgi:hypothetical protein